MLTKFIILAALVSFALFFGSLIYVMVVNYLAVRKFRKQAPQMPLAPNRDILTNHFGDCTFRADNWKIFNKNHSSLGESFGWFVNEKAAVSTLDLDLIKRVVLDNPDANINTDIFVTPLPELDQDSLITCSDEQWRRLRRVYASALSERKIKSHNVQVEFAQVLNRSMDSLDRRFNSQIASEMEVNLDDFCARWSWDLASTSLLKQPNLINHETPKEHLIDTIERGFRILITPFARFGLIPLFHRIVNWIGMNFHSTGAMRMQMKKILAEQASLASKVRKEAKAEAEAKGVIDFDFSELHSFRTKDGSSFHRNILDFIVDKLHDGTVSKREYLHSTFFLFIAAGKTTADVATSIIFHLAKHPQVQEKLRAGLLTEGLKCEYLSWVIHESIRLLPPITVFRRVSTDMSTSNALPVPEGTTVVPNSYLIHRLKQYWGEDAEKFKPERWAQAKSFHPCQYLGFGLGKRNCPGSKFALEGLKMLVDALLRRYKLESSDKSNEIDVVAAPVVVLLFGQPTYVRMSRINVASLTSVC